MASEIAELKVEIFAACSGDGNRAAEVVDVDVVIDGDGCIGQERERRARGRVVVANLDGLRVTTVAEDIGIPGIADNIIARQKECSIFNGGDALEIFALGCADAAKIDGPAADDGDARGGAAENSQRQVELSARSVSQLQVDGTA